MVRWLIYDSLQPWWSLIWKNTCQTDFSQFFQRPIFKTSFLIKRFFLASVIIFLGTLSHVIIASFVISCSYGFSARPLFSKRPYWFFCDISICISMAFLIRKMTNISTTLVKIYRLLIDRFFLTPFPHPASVYHAQNMAHCFHRRFVYPS